MKQCNSGPPAPEWLESSCSEREVGQRMEVDEPVGPQGQPASACSTAADGDTTAASLLGRQLLRRVPREAEMGCEPSQPQQVLHSHK